MHTKSLPPSDQDELIERVATTAPPSLPSLPPVKFTEVLRADLETYIATCTPKISQREVALELGVSVTVVNFYLNKKPVGDIPGLESRVADYLKNAPERERLKIEVFESEITQRLAADLSHIRKTRDLAVITGPSGVGKSCGAGLYVAQNPTSVLLTAYKYRCNSDAVRRMLWDAVDTRGWSPATHSSKWDYLVLKFRGSSRLIIVDNCHKLTTSGIEVLFDFHDETGCPIGFTGNPEFLKTLARLRDNDQQLSRVGIFRELALKKPHALAEHMLERLEPGHKKELLTLATQVAAQRGHGRSVRKHLALAKELLLGGIPDIATAFMAAHSQLLNREYPLNQ